MIGFLCGRVADIQADSCMLDVGGVGYIVYLTGSARSGLKTGEETLLYTHLAVREDALTLFGFSSREEYQAFQLMISVSGIGPKVAIGVLSAITAEDFYRAVREKKTAVLVGLPGIGKKTAERLILELKDKVGSSADTDAKESTPYVSEDVTSEAAAALSALGYTPAEINPVLRRAEGISSVEALVKFALMEFAKGAVG